MASEGQHKQVTHVAKSGSVAHRGWDNFTESAVYKLMSDEERAALDAGDKVMLVDGSTVELVWA